MDFKICASGISTIGRVRIGGISQSLLIQGESVHNPVLLFLHGGPGVPVPGTCCRGVDYVHSVTTSALVKHFTLVYWDQRGTGKSYSTTTLSATLHLEQFITDAAEVTDYLRNRFHQEKIHLAAHSWGTVIGLFLVHRYPERFASYTAFAQIVDWARNDQLSYKWLRAHAVKESDTWLLKQLRTLGEPPYDDVAPWVMFRALQASRRTATLRTGDMRSPSLAGIPKVMLRSKDFSFRDIYNTQVRGPRLLLNRRIIRELNRFDFSRQARRIEVPALFIHGAKDRQVLPEPVEQYVAALDAPAGKKLWLSERSAHLFHRDDAKANEQRLLQLPGRTAPAGYLAESYG